MAKSRGRPEGSNRRSKAKDKKFFEALAQGLSIKEAATEANYPYRSALRYKSEMADFRDECERINNVRFEMLKEKVFEIAVNGITETKITKNAKGKEVSGDWKFRQKLSKGFNGY